MNWAIFASCILSGPILMRVIEGLCAMADFWRLPVAGADESPTTAGSAGISESNSIWSVDDDDAPVVLRGLRLCSISRISPAARRSIYYILYCICLILYPANKSGTES